MEVSGVGSILSGVLLVVVVVLLAGLCVSCRKSSNRTSIPQYFGEDDYIQQCQPGPGGFRVVRPACTAPPVTTRSSGHSAHLPAFGSSPMLDPIRRSSFNPADNGITPTRRTSCSQDDDYVNEENDDDDEVKGEGYIEVLPDPPTAVSNCTSHQSLASTQSSGRGNYVNVEDERSDTSSQNYINVNAEDPVGLQAGSLGTLDNFDSDNSISDYVNTSEFINNIP